MLRKFLITAFCLTSISAQADNRSRVPDSLEQINADLLAKKAKSQPFNDKDVKVDLESLGLDEIDAKDGIKNPTTKTTNQIVARPAEKIAPAPIVKVVSAPIPTTSAVAEKLTTPAKKTVLVKELDKTILVKELDKTKIITPEDISVTPPAVISAEPEPEKNILPKSEDLKKIGSDAILKVQNFIKKTKDDITAKKDDPAPTSQITTPISNKSEKVNDLKKRNLKKQLAAKKAAKKLAELNEKKRAEKLANLNKLRKKYLIKITPTKDAQEARKIDDLDDEEEVKIIPQKKDINKFVSYETPADPILNRYRSAENVGIPIILSRREKVENLFRSVLREDISYFNSAFDDISEPNVRNSSGDTILTYSILLQKHDVAASALGKGANPNLANNLGYTPLQIAIEMADFTAFTLLINSNANVNYVDGFGRTYLMHAARMGLLSAVELLIKKGVDVNAMDADGFTALAIANRYRQELTIALLIKNGAKTWIEKPYEPQEESLIKELDSRWKN